MMRRLMRTGLLHLPSKPFRLSVTQGGPPTDNSIHTRPFGDPSFDCHGACLCRHTFPRLETWTSMFRSRCVVNFRSSDSRDDVSIERRVCRRRWWWEVCITPSPSLLLANSKQLHLSNNFSFCSDFSLPPGSRKEQLFLRTDSFWLGHKPRLSSSEAID